MAEYSKVLRYVDAYIKQTLKYTKIDYIKELSNERKYTDLLKKRNDGLLTLVDAESDRYIYEKIQVDDYIIKISELTITDSEKEIEVKYLDRDLMQQLNLSVVECLPNLRENIKRHIDPLDDFEIQIKAE